MKVLYSNEAYTAYFPVIFYVWVSVHHKSIQRDSKRWTQFLTSIFPELYMVCGRST